MNTNWIRGRRVPARLVLCMFLGFGSLLWHHKPAGAQVSHAGDSTFYVVRDTPRQMAIEDVCCDTPTLRFSKEPVASVRTSYGENSLWLKLANPGSFDLLQFYPILDEVTLYAKNQNGGGWIAWHTGDQIANEQKAIVAPQMVLPLPPFNEGSQIYVRIRQTAAVTVSARYWTNSDFAAFKATDERIKVFLLGFVSAIILYNLFVSAIVRDLVFLFNALCVSSLLVQSLYLSGFGAAYVWNGWPGLSNFMNVASLFFSIVFGATFIWLFLREKTVRLRDIWPILPGPASAVIAAFASGLLPYWLTQVLLLVSAALFLAGGLWLNLRLAIAGSVKAIVLLIPLGLAMIPGVALVAMDKIAGLKIPGLEGNVLEIILCAEAILFSLALAYRIRITEFARDAAHAELLQLRDESAEQIIEAQEAERRRIAKELHDGVGQGFLFVVGQLKQLSGGNSRLDVGKLIEQSVQSAGDALNDLRRILQDLYPVSLDHLGLKKSIQNLFETLELSHQIDTRLDLNFDEARLNRPAQLHIYRILQECVSNISRHSEASRCACSIVASRSALDIVIEDDGIGPGTTADRRNTGGGLGLISINERVRALDGAWTLSNAQPEGTLIRLSVPIAE